MLQEEEEEKTQVKPHANKVKNLPQISNTIKKIYENGGIYQLTEQGKLLAN
jgi:hypothetical protein